jgi:hypothetical protein
MSGPPSDPPPLGEATREAAQQLRDKVSALREGMGRLLERAAGQATSVPEAGQLDEVRKERGTENAEVRALKEQVSSLKQQVASLRAQAPSDANAAATGSACAADPASKSGGVPGERRLLPDSSNDALFKRLRALGDTALKTEFDKFADIKDSSDQDQHCMTPEGLAKALAALNFNHDAGGIEGLVARIDSNNDGKIDFKEFRFLVKSDSEIVMVLKSLELERAVAANMPRGTPDDPLAGFWDMTDSEIDAAVGKSVAENAAVIKECVHQRNAAKKKEAETGGFNKFGAVLTGGGIKQFDEGISTIVGEPNSDLQEGVRLEHMESKDSDEEFSTGNYGLTTTPSMEYNLAMGGGEGLERVQVMHEGKEVEHVVVEGTRCAYKQGEVKKVCVRATVCVCVCE